MRKLGSAYKEKINSGYIFRAGIIVLLILFSSFLFYYDPQFTVNVSTSPDNKIIAFNPLISWIREAFEWLSELY